MSDSQAVRGSNEPRKRTGIPTFYRQVVAELRKVVYPTQEQLVTYFFVVMAFVLVMIGAFIVAVFVRKRKHVRVRALSAEEREYLNALFNREGSE